MYLELNLFAAPTISASSEFRPGILTAYSLPRRGTMCVARILARALADADDLRMRFFERLSRTGRLVAELVGSARGGCGSACRPMGAGPRIRIRRRCACSRRAKRGAAISNRLRRCFFAIENNFPADATVDRRTMAIIARLELSNPD